MSVTGIVGDLHLPFAHPMYLRFVQDTFDKWMVKRVVFIGDIADCHSVSFWEHNPDGYSPGHEFEKTRKEIDKWKSTYPKADVCIGNHDERYSRVAKRFGLSVQYLKDYKNIWNTPKWNWDFSHTIDGVLYEHGTGTSGKDAAFNLALQKRISTVIGHIHSYAGVKWHANNYNTIFGMNVGCGIDCSAYAFDYGRAMAVRPMLGCGIVQDGKYATFIPMPCGVGEKYNRSKA